MNILSSSNVCSFSEACSAIAHSNMEPTMLVVAFLVLVAAGWAGGVYALKNEACTGALNHPVGFSIVQAVFAVSVILGILLLAVFPFLSVFVFGAGAFCGSLTWNAQMVA
jgi:hypothetical protein